MELYLYRHGETEWSLSGRHTGKTDIPLTPNGRRQAALLRKGLQGIHFEKIFTSPRKRALETCEGMGAIVDLRLAEWDYGDYEGQTRQQIGPRWDLFTQGAPGGESPQQVVKRVDDFLKMIAQYKGKVAIFSHGHFLKVLMARFLKQPPKMAKLFSLAVASVSILGYDRGEPIIFLWNSPSDRKD